MGLKLLFEEFQDGYSPWPPLICKWKDLAILSLKRALSFEDVV